MKTVKLTFFAGTALMVAAGSVFSAPTGKLSWFDETPFAGVGSIGVPKIQLRDPADYSSFDVDLYRSQQEFAEESYPDFSNSANRASTVQLYGELESIPNYPRYSSFEGSETSRVNAFGLKWHHHLDSINSFAVTAEYGEGTAVSPHPLDTFDARAAFSWTSRLPMTLSPSITGSVYLGDEMAREDIYRHLGRKYYGFTVGGSLTLFQSHTPYVSFKMQKGLYDMTDEPIFVSSRSGDRSLLSAGWRWQVQRDFSLQAEASYGLGSSSTSLDPNTLERSRILFGTRFGFK